MCHQSLPLLLPHCPYLSFFFFFNDTATTEIYTLSLHDALPISWSGSTLSPMGKTGAGTEKRWRPECRASLAPRSEEHTSELQSQSNLVCRLLLEKKKKKRKKHKHYILISEKTHVDEPSICDS